ncbi:MAG: hypothetical protein DCC71_07730 [Proteobacteria bacterium]|nr:MAG: hypothetical protein DCC71_07730 [Pseudomonadota bacterium]
MTPASRPLSRARPDGRGRGRGDRGGVGGLLTGARLREIGVRHIRFIDSAAFHASRWDFAYTGGDSHGNLTGLRGKRVGIIGTGATAVQIVPHVAEAAEHRRAIAFAALLGLGRRLRPRRGGGRRAAA